MRIFSHLGQRIYALNLFKQKATKKKIGKKTHENTLIFRKSVYKTEITHIRNARRIG